MCLILGVENLFTTTYLPQCNGQGERFNRTILDAWRHYVADHQHDWDLFSDAVTFAYNTQVHSVTKVSPFELVLSRPPNPLAIQPQPKIDFCKDKAQFQTNWVAWLERMFKSASKESKKVQERYKKYFDLRVRKPKRALSPGPLVFVRREYANPKTEKKHELSPIADGPYLVISVQENICGPRKSTATHEKNVAGPSYRSHFPTPRP